MYALLLRMVWQSLSLTVSTATLIGDVQDGIKHPPRLFGSSGVRRCPSLEDDEAGDDEEHGRHEAVWQALSQYEDRGRAADKGGDRADLAHVDGPGNPL